MTSDCGPDGEIPRWFESNIPPKYIQIYPLIGSEKFKSFPGFLPGWQNVESLQYLNILTPLK